MTAWTTLAVLDWTTRRFTDAGLDTPRLDAQVLLMHVLCCTRVHLYTHFDKPLAEGELAQLREMIRRRLAGQPVAYLVGEQEFWSAPFFVDSNVLIPRHDTEVVIQVVLDAFPDRATPRRILDLCTGSGAIGVTLARELPGATVVASDVSAAAAALATRNAERNGVAARVEVRVGDLWSAVHDGEQFDIIVSNPPYVVHADIAKLSAEVRAEPAIALDGGADGLDFYRRLVARLASHLAPSGLVAFEHGFDQATAVIAQLAQVLELAPAQARADLAGHPRVTWARRGA